ncbi:MAG: aldo/keto reductase [Oscillospiraceae bacterium]|jgi:predicted aldo/keto reductase-like oxidoreductase|nr:aldo/keto reductase [Oscillospiraceae bacterium]
MTYKTNPKNGDRLSVLGFGGMRFPKSEEETEKLLLSAIRQGVNYFDTAYIYSGSEAAIGRIFTKNNCRADVKIATKLPYYMARKKEDIDRLWNTQLSRLQTDYIDYYMIHMLTELSQWEKLKSFDIEAWIAAKKSAGSIVNMGFSYHGGNAQFKKIIDAYDWDFCMIQYNYLDEFAQAGKDGLQYAAAKGIPVMIMEPLRGGTLAANLPKEAQALFKQADPSRSPAEWGLRWVWNHPEVFTVLSGMTTQEILDENVRIAQTAAPGSLSEQELQTVAQARDIIKANTRVACTGCNYCAPCPKGVDIPLCFTLYNESFIKKGLRTKVNYLTYVGSHNAGACAQCGRCEKHCPQSIPIQKELRNVKKEMERFPYGIMRFFVKKVMKQE